MITRSRRRVSAARLRAVAEELLEASTLCAISTVSPGGRSHVNTAYFAWAPDLRIVWFSEPRARHSRNLRANPSAAVAVYDSGQTWGKPDRGIQLFGTAGVAAKNAAREARRVYGRRFRDYDAEVDSLPVYRFQPRTVKLFDERSLAPVTFVTARVARDGLTWLKTEVSV